MNDDYVIKWTAFPPYQCRLRCHRFFCRFQSLLLLTLTFTSNPDKRLREYVNVEMIKINFQHEEIELKDDNIIRLLEYNLINSSVCRLILYNSFMPLPTQTIHSTTQAAYQHSTSAFTILSQDIRTAQRIRLRNGLTKPSSTHCPIFFNYSCENYSHSILHLLQIIFILFIPFASNSNHKSTIEMGKI